MCGAPCNDGPDSPPRTWRPVTVIVPTEGGGIASVSGRVSTHLSPDDLAADVLDSLQRKSGADYVEFDPPS